MGASGWGETLRGWRYPQVARRDARLDLLRGFCLFAMIVDHIGGPSFLHLFTTGNTFYVSAAEGFVFISGLLVGIVYRGVLAREGLRAAARKALVRARTLYVLMVALTLVFYYISLPLGLFWTRTVDMSNPLAFAWQVMTFQRSFHLTDVLALYVLLLLGTPVALWLLHTGRTRWLLGGSWALWLAYQFAPELAAQPLAGVKSFHPAAWQVFFVHAMAIGYHRAALARWMHQRRRMRIAAIALAVLVAVGVVYATGGSVLGTARPLLGEFIDKTSVGPGRLLTAAAFFPLAYLLVTYLWGALTRALGWLLLPLGENSLYSYTLHVPLVAAANLLGDSPGTTLASHAANVAAQLAALFIIWRCIQRKVLFGVLPR